jgi:hypothetical protein
MHSTDSTVSLAQLPDYAEIAARQHKSDNQYHLRKLDQHHACILANSSSPHIIMQLILT